MEIFKTLFSITPDPKYIPFKQLVKGKNLIIYGAGGMYDSFNAFVLSRSPNLKPILVDIKFIDQLTHHKYDPESFFNQLNLNSLGNVNKSDLVVICIGNQKNSREIQNIFIKQGFFNVLLAYEIYEYNLIYASEDFANDSSMHLLKDQDKIQQAYDLMSDKLSKDTFFKFLKVYLEKKPPDFGASTYETQYMPPDLPLINENIRLLNCGAYNGDTLLSLIKHYGKLQLACALEPDMDNFKKLSTNQLIRIGCDILILLPLGASNRTNISGFHNGNGMISRISKNLDTGKIIQTVKLDQILLGLNFNKIIIDTEGHEKQILEGLSDIIEASHPELCIAAYHDPTDIYELVLSIHEKYPKYKFYLRNHSSANVDTVLYALVK
jgi:FkbM family methyltransferase